MNVRTATIYWVTAIVFLLVATVTVFGKAGDAGMASVWLALGATFVGLGTAAARKPR